MHPSSSFCFLVSQLKVPDGVIVQLGMDNINKEQKSGQLPGPKSAQKPAAAKRVDGSIVVSFKSGPNTNPGDLSVSEPLQSLTKMTAADLLPDQGVHKRFLDYTFQLWSKVSVLQFS